MAWGKVDDKLHSSPKWRACTKGGRALWVTALSWSMDQLTDGRIPAHMLAALDGTVRDAEGLVRVGLWDEADDGWCFHDWTDYQPSREHVLAERDAAKERQRRARERSRESRRDGAVTDGVSHGVSSVPPTRPDPLKRTTTSADADVARRATRLPDSWTPTDEHIARAAQSRLDVGREFVKFRAHAQEKGRTAKNWNAAFTRWLMNAAEYAARDARTTRPAQSRVEQNLDVVRQIAERDGLLPLTPQIGA
jgi:hypothetical protein